ncbi:tetratricopeptide repeat protein [Martelella lutilitoris]|uniref:Tetratricopeptide repeat protein n=1 Tax=Martelella lutilitoris TaxID=2583532 RepID=A0A5C4JXU8_9HYPH|nr:tetratricopeptide repeat protein [Martelella lutilitoris]TNB49439.1 tetratricopeptide repeat protein [Martelella lutilitoris]
MTNTIPMKRLLTTAALAAALMLPLSASAETNSDSEAALDAAMEAVSAESFAGALLAGQTAAFDNDLDRAVAYFRRALQYRPEDAGTNNQLFIALIFNGDLKGAEAQAAKTTDEPQLVPLRELSLALAALSEERYDDAITMLDDFGGSALDELVSALLKAWALTGKGEPDAALAGLEALSGPPWYDLFVNYNAGAIAALSGETAKARTHLNAALADREGGVTAPDTMLATVIGLAAIEQQAGNTRKALDTVSVAETYGLNAAVLEPIRERIEAGAPVMGLPETAKAGASGVLFEIAAALNQGTADDIVSLYLALAEALNPGSPDVLYLSGVVEAANDRPERALSYFSRIPEDATQYRLAELQQGIALAELDRKDEAVEMLYAMVEDAPDDRRGYLALSGVLSSEKRFAEMAEVLDRAASRIGPVAAPEDWSIFYRRGIAYERLKEWDKAEPNFLRALELYPDQPQVLNYLGYSWIDQGMNLEEGLDLINQAVDQRPDDGYIVDSLGWAYYRLGRYEDALRELERAVALDTGDPTINDHLGDAYWQVGRKLEAIYQWNKALAAEPDEDLIPEIKAKIAHGLPAERQDDDSPLAQSPEGDGGTVQ